MTNPGLNNPRTTVAQETGGHERREFYMRRGKKGIMETGGENVILREVRLVDRRRECCKRSGKTGRQEERML